MYYFHLHSSQTEHFFNCSYSYGGNKVRHSIYRKLFKYLFELINWPLFLFNNKIFKLLIQINKLAAEPKSWISRTPIWQYVCLKVPGRCQFPWQHQSSLSWMEIQFLFSHFSDPPPIRNNWQHGLLEMTSLHHSPHWYLSTGCEPGCTPSTGAYGKKMSPVLKLSRS